MWMSNTYVCSSRFERARVGRRSSLSRGGGVALVAALLGLVAAACTATTDEPGTTSSVAGETTTTSTSAVVSGTSYAIYQRPEEITAVMTAAGMGCAYIEAVPPEEIAGTPGLVGHIECAWPDEPLQVLVFAAEDARVLFVFSVLGFGCFADPDLPESISYAYGPNWVVLPDYGDSPLEVMERLAAELGGAATASNCATLGDFFDSLPPSLFEGDSLSDLGNIDVASWKGALGEIDFPYTAPDQLPVAPAPPAAGGPGSAPEVSAVFDGTMVAFDYGRVYVWQPPDPTTWTQSELRTVDGDEIHIEQVIVTPQGFAAAGSALVSVPVVIQSENGRDWMTSVLPGEWGLDGIAFGAEGFLASGRTYLDGESRATLWVSDDGGSWEEYSPSDVASSPLASHASWFAIAANASGYLVITGTEAWFTTDLVSWVAGDVPEWGRSENSSRPALGELTVYQDQFLVSAFDGVWVSVDGLSWVQASDVGLHGGSWIAVGEGRVLAGSWGVDVLLSSEDGQTWVRVELLGDEPGWGPFIGEVTYGPGGFYLMADLADANAWATWTSVDGAEWSRVG